MSFQLHPDAELWFKKVFKKEPLGTYFDVYQLCFTLGIAGNRHAPLDKDGRTFTDEVIQRYKTHKLLLVGAMLAKTIKRQGVELADRNAVVKEIERLVDSSGGGMELTPDGYRELNAYATGGFNCLRDDLEEAPSDMTYLLDRYHKLLDEVRNDVLI